MGDESSSQSLLDGKEQENSKHWDKHMKSRSSRNKKQLSMTSVMGNLTLDTVYKLL